MDPNYVLACGIVWYKTADAEAGSELVEALQSRDPRVRLLAQTLLTEAGEESLRLLESALADGVLCAQIAAPCMAEILRNRHARHANAHPSHERLSDLSVC